MTLAVTALAAVTLALLATHTIDALDRIRETIVSIQDTIQDTIDAIVAQLGKAKTEIIARIAELQVQIDSGVPAEQLDLGPLTEIAQALDDVVPDAAQPVEPTE